MGRRRSKLRLAYGVLCTLLFAMPVLLWPMIRHKEFADLAWLIVSTDVLLMLTLRPILQSKGQGQYWILLAVFNVVGGLMICLLPNKTRMRGFEVIPVPR